jgi:hypothetical protein
MTVNTNTTTYYKLSISGPFYLSGTTFYFKSRSILIVSRIIHPAVCISGISDTGILAFQGKYIDGIKSLEQCVHTTADLQV